MSTFEFVSVLFSLVLSLAVAHLLTGVAQVIRAKKVRFGWVHAGWWLFSLLLCVDWWFSLWQRRDDDSTWTLGFVLFELWQLAVLYVVAWLIVPDVSEEGEVDMPAFHDANRRKYLAGMLIWILGGIVSNGLTPSLNLANLIAPITLTLFAVAWWWKHKFVQIAVVVLMYALFTYYAVNFIPAL